MLLRRLLLVIIASLTSIALAYGQDSDSPTVAILRYGGAPGETTFSEFGVLEILQADGFITAEERAALDTRQDLEGEHINIFWGDAGWDLATVNLMVDDALGREADAVITVTTPVTRAALNATLDMDEPPALLFASVFNPAESGIAAAACDKPAHATGSVIEAPYARALEVLQTQNPDLSAIGILFSTGETTGVAGAELVAQLAEDMGISVTQAAVNSLADFPLAAQSLADDMVDAIIAPIDAVTAQALPVISSIANESGIPVVYPILGSVYHGTTFGVGMTSHYAQGLHLGRLLAARLRGELDIAATGLAVYTGDAHSVNLDAAAEQVIDIAQTLIDSAHIVIENGEASQSEAFTAAYAIQSQAALQSEEARAAAAEFMASLAC